MERYGIVNDAWPEVRVLETRAAPFFCLREALKFMLTYLK